MRAQKALWTIEAITSPGAGEGRLVCHQARDLRLSPFAFSLTSHEITFNSANRREKQRCQPNPSDHSTESRRDKAWVVGVRYGGFALFHF